MLSKKEHWDGIYQHISPNRSRFESYGDQYLINLCKRFIPANQNSKFIEIGCAPGTNIVNFHNAFGFQPYGVDYSANGCVKTIDTFKSNKLNTQNIFLADFLSSKFQDAFKGHFDVVSSFGFLEHFQDSKDIIDKHLNLLKPGGYLIITIPNLLSINRIISDFLNPAITKICNLDIMDKSRFIELFNRNDLKNLYCGYYGIFNFGLFNAPHDSKKQIFMHIGGISQIIMDRVLVRLFLNRNIECSAINPYLIYIGRKV